MAVRPSVAEIASCSSSSLSSFTPSPVHRVGRGAAVLQDQGGAISTAASTTGRSANARSRMSTLLVVSRNVTSTSSPRPSIWLSTSNRRGLPPIGPKRAVSGNQVDILKDDNRSLHHTSNAASLTDQSESLAGEHERRGRSELYGPTGSGRCGSCQSLVARQAGRHAPVLYEPALGVHCGLLSPLHGVRSGKGWDRAAPSLVTSHHRPSHEPKRTVLVPFTLTHGQRLAL